MSQDAKPRFHYFLRAIATFIALSLFLGGCSKEPSSQSISFVVRTGLESEGLKKVAQEYTKKTGVKVEAFELGRDGYLSAVPSQLVARAATFDVAFIPSTMVAELASGKAILALDNYVNTRDPDLIATYGYQGQTFALPTDLSTMFLYYRKDLIAEPPQTWQEVLDLAKRFSKATNPASPTQYGLAFPGMSGEELPKAFYSVLWSFGGFISDGTHVGIGNKESIAAAEFYRRLVEEKVVPQDVTSWGFAQIYENLENGKLAMAAPFWNAAASLLLNSKGKYGDKIAWTLVPGVRVDGGNIQRVPFQHAWTLAVSATSKNPKAAAEFVAFATGKEGGQIYAQAVSGNPARYSLLEAPELRKARPEFDLLLKSLKIARPEPETPKYAAMHDVMNEALTKVLTGNQTATQAMEQAGDKLSKLGLGTLKTTITQPK